MTFYQFITEVRNKFKDELPSFCTERELEAVTVVDSAFDLEKKNLSVCIFPTASSGSTFSMDDGADMVRMTVMLFCNRNATSRGVLQAEKYYSVLIQYIQKSLFGESSTLADSVLIRMDEGEPVNGGTYLIESRINTHTDYGWD